MKAVIVEDSRLARLELKELLAQYRNVEVVGEAEGFDQAIKVIERNNPDVIFLDIQLPGKDGFELLEHLERLPNVIFTTAYDEYAIKSFEFNALDYLLKPITAARLEKSISKLTSVYEQSERRNRLDAENRIFIKDGELCWIVEVKNIELFESCGNYTRVHFDNVKPFIYKSLNKIESRLDIEQFFRANRQTIINLNFVFDITLMVNGNYRLTMKSGTFVDLSRSQSSRLKNLLSI